MAIFRYQTVSELSEALVGAQPPTADDVSVLLDGTRLDSREKVLAWLETIHRERQEAQRV